MTIAPPPGVSTPNVTTPVTPVRAVAPVASVSLPLPELNPAQIMAQAVAGATQAAAVRQGGLAPLVADLSQALESDGGEMPAPVRNAALRVLAQAPPLTAGVTPERVAKAMSQSGLFMEARLAANPSASPVGVDLKAGLLILRQALTTWLAGAPPAAQPAAAARPTPQPPFRGSAARAQSHAAPSLPKDAPAVTVGRVLAQETDSALARQELLQAASLPVEGGPDAQVTRWMFELPFATPQGAGVAAFEVSRDGRGTGVESDPVWRAAFAMDADPLGPIHARVSLRGGEASVSLWAERAEGLERLRQDQGSLVAAFAAVRLHAEINVHPGAPPQRPPSAGALIDRLS